MKKSWDNFFEKKEEVKVDVNAVISSLYSKLEEDVVKIEIGLDLLPFIDDILQFCSDFRLKTFFKTGFILPPVHFVDSDSIQENEYRVYVQGLLIKTGFVVFTKDEILKEFSTVFDYLYENELDEIFTNEATENYLKKVEEKNYRLSQEITNFYDMHDIKQIFVNLLKNNKSIKNISSIVEKICAVNTENINKNNYDRLFYRPISVERITKMICE